MLLFSKVPPDWLDRVLDYIESVFWQEQTKTDNTTPIFYVYKAYPSSLNGKRLESWIKLQEKVLSPYKNGDCHSVNLKKGVALWMSNTSLVGIPETAKQQALPDGTFFVRGDTFMYRQEWKGGVMTACETLSLRSLNDDTILLSDRTSKNAWAQSRHVDEFIKKPIFGFFVLAFLTFIFSVWLGTAYITQSLAVSNLNSEMHSLEASVGDTLATRDTFQKNALQIQQLTNWKNELADLPSILAVVVVEVEKQTPWVAGKIQWQNRALKITLFSNELEITSLVKNLEETGLFDSVAIRPQDKAGLWTLEVVVSD